MNSSKQSKSQVKSESMSLNLINVFMRERTFFSLIFIFLIFLYVKGLGGVLLSDEYTTYQEFFQKGWENLRLMKFNVFSDILFFLFGLNPIPHRIFFLLLHCINIILFFTIFRYYYPEKALKIGIIILASHSLIVEPLVWVSSNSYISLAFFHLLAIYFSLLYHHKNKFYYHVIACLIVAILTIGGSHSNFISLFFIAFNIFFLGRSFKKELLMSGWLILLIPFYTFFNSGLVSSRVESLTTGPFIPKFIQTLPFTVAKSTEIVLFPLNVTFFHEETMYPSYYLFAQIFTFFAICFFFWLFFKSKNYFRLLLLALLFPVYVFSPIQIAWFVAERYMYLSVFFFTLAFGLLVLFLERKFGKIVASVVVSSYFLFFTFRSFIRILDWQDAITLWSQNVKIAPDSLRVRSNLGESFLIKGMHEEARKEFKEVLRLSPRSGHGELKLASVYMKERNFSEAERYLQRSLNLDPKNVISYIYLAATYLDSNKIDKAEEVITLLEKQNIYPEIKPEVDKLKEYMLTKKQGEAKSDKP